MKQDPVNSFAAAEHLEAPFQPRIIARFNDHKVMVVKTQGEFVWHTHPETDDFFYVLRGELVIDLRDRSVTLGAGDVFVVPRGVEHRPRSESEAEVLLIEPLGTVNTGDAPASGLTAPELDS